MKAGYLVSKAIKKKLKSWSKQRVINWLATWVGAFAAKKIVEKAVTVSTTALASYLAANVTWLTCLASPVAGLIFGGIGWL